MIERAVLLLISISALTVVFAGFCDGEAPFELPIRPESELGGQAIGVAGEEVGVEVL